MIVTIIACASIAAHATAPAAVHVTANERADAAPARARLVAALASKPVARRTFDLSIKANVAATAARADITVDVRLVVSDEQGKMLAVVCATAAAQGHPTSITQLRQQAAADAIVAVVDRLPAD